MNAIVCVESETSGSLKVLDSSGVYYYGFCYQTIFFSRLKHGLFPIDKRAPKYNKSSLMFLGDAFQEYKHKKLKIT